MQRGRPGPGCPTPAATAARGGVVLPIWQAEALWLSFTNHSPHPDLPFPVAITVAAGSINAVTGEGWRPGLHRRPQDYMVSPEQPWLDGYAVDKGIIRQFVAMPLGEGTAAEEQLTGQAQWGGLQIAVVPLRAEVWRARREAWERRRRRERGRGWADETSSAIQGPSEAFSCARAAPMGLAAGGRMRQAIERDPFRLGDWDMAGAQRVFVTLMHARDWPGITGEAAPNRPPSAQDYARAGLPRYEWYGRDQRALPGGKRLAGLCQNNRR